MFKYIKLSYPEATYSPKFIYKAVLYQNMYEHEMMVVTYKDWNIIYDTIKAGSPVSGKIVGSKSSRNFYGYIHHIQPNNTPGKKFTDVVIIGGSFPMKQATQKVYRDYTADQVVKEIALKHGLSFYGTPHPRVFEQISQAGYTDWQLAVKLAKQIGYHLRTENTEVYFEPILLDFTRYRSQAPIFVMRDTGSIEGSTLYSFNPLIGESLEYDKDMKSAVAIGGVDRFAKIPLKYTKQKRNKTTKTKTQDEFFDRFNSLVVAPNQEIAKYEAEAADARNSFPYRGTAQVIGEPSLRPGMPVFLDGIGKNYSGYWTILGVEHNIVETEREVFTYTSTITIGSDSVGAANRWTDGTIIKQPPSRSIRNIEPGVRQTKTKPSSTLITKAVKASQAKTGSFGVISNRKKETTNTKTPGVWKTKTPTPSYTFTQKAIKSPAVAVRVRERNSR